MNAVFVELPAFERHRERYLNDAALAGLQLLLMNNPEAGRTIQGTGGCARFDSAIRAEARASAAVCA
jgi:hypothetical protein